MAVAADWIRLGVGLSLVAAVFTSAWVIQNKYSAASVYVCYYGEWSHDPGVPDYTISDPMAVQGRQGLKDIRCYETQSADNFTCPPGYDRTEYRGKAMMTQSDVEKTQVNRSII